MASQAVLELVIQMKDQASKDIGRITGEVHRLDGATLKVTSSVGGFGGAMAKGLGGLNAFLGPLGLGVAGLGSFAEMLGNVTKLAMEEQTNIAAMTTALQANIVGWDGNTAAIERTIAGRQNLAFADDVLRNSLASLVTRTHDVNAAFDLQGIAMDLARGKHIELSTASDIVGKVFSGNTGILQRYGIVVAEGASATQALGAIQQTFAGQAEAYGATAAGSVERLKNAFDDAMETVGSAVLPLVANFATLMADLLPKIMDVVTSITDKLKPAFEVIGFVLNIVGTSLDWLGQQFGLWESKSKDSTSNVKGHFTQLATDVGVASTDTANAFGTNLVGGIDSYRPDVFDAATGIYDALDITNDAGRLGENVGYVYVYGGPGGVTPAIYGGRQDVGFAAGSVVAAMDKSAEAGQMGTYVGSAMTAACAAAVQNGLVSLRNQAQSFIDTIQASTSAAAGTVGSPLGVPRQLPMPNIVGPRGGAGTGPPALGAPGAPLGAPVSPAIPWSPGYDLPNVNLGSSKYRYQADDGSWWPLKSMAEQRNRELGWSEDQKRERERAAKAAGSGRAGSAGGGGGRGGSGGASGKDAKSNVQSAIDAAIDMTSKISSAVQAGIEALGKLSNFTLPAGFQNGVEQFAQGINAVMMRMQDVALQFKAEMLQHTGLFLDTASKAMDLVSKGVDALAKLGEFQKPADSYVNAFIDSVQYVINKLGDIASKWSIDSLAILGLFSESTGKAMDMVSKAVDSLMKLRDFQKPSDVAMQSFVDALDYLTDKMRRVIAKWDSASLSLAADFGEHTGKLVDGLGKAVDTLGKLVDFKRPADDAINGFFDALDAILPKVSDRSRQWYGLINEGVADLAGWVGKAVTGMFGAVDGMLKLAAPGVNLPGDLSIRGFFDALDRIAPLIAERARSWYGLINESLADVAGYVGKAVTGVLGAVDGFLKLGSPDWKAPTDEAINQFFDALDKVVPLIGERMRQWYGLINESSADLAGYVGSAVSDILGAVDGIIKLADFKGIPEGAIEAFFASMWSVLDQVNKVITGLPAGFADQAAAFADKINLIFSAIKSGFDVASSIGGEGGGSIGEGFATALAKAQELMGYIDPTALNAVQSFVDKTIVMRDTWVTGVQSMIDKWDEFMRKIGGGSPPNPSVPQGTINIPGFASGGIVTRPTLAWVGERGAEAVIPLSRMGRGGNGVSLVINTLTINAGLGVDGGQLSRQLIDELDYELGVLIRTRAGRRW